MNFGTSASAKDFTIYRRWLEESEGAGFDLLTGGDSQSLWADCYSMMTFAATATKDVDLAIVVSNPKTRHPAVAASAAASIQLISNGRFHLGIASGDSALRNIGVRAGRVYEVAEYVTCVQALTEGATVRWHGRDLSLSWVNSQARVPVWMAAEGPRTQRLAGAIADGIVLSNSLSEDRFAAAMEHIGQGATEAGRSVDDIDIWFMCNLVFAPSEDEGIDRIKSIIAGTANHVYRFTLKDKGVSDENAERVLAMMSEYQSQHHGDVAMANPNSLLIEKYGLKSFLARQGTVAGPPDQCVERLKELSALGIKRLIVNDFSTISNDWTNVFASKVRPEFSSLQ
jgi:5,10-methylenetetrahydromethanopterin reductase